MHLLLCCVVDVNVDVSVDVNVDVNVDVTAAAAAPAARAAASQLYAVHCCSFLDVLCFDLCCILLCPLPKKQYVAINV